MPTVYRYPDILSLNLSARFYNSMTLVGDGNPPEDVMNCAPHVIAPFKKVSENATKTYNLIDQTVTREQQIELYHVLEKDYHFPGDELNITLRICLILYDYPHLIERFNIFYFRFTHVLMELFDGAPHYLIEYGEKELKVVPRNKEKRKRLLHQLRLENDYDAEYEEIRARSWDTYEFNENIEDPDGGNRAHSENVSDAETKKDNIALKDVDNELHDDEKLDEEQEDEEEFEGEEGVYFVGSGAEEDSDSEDYPSSVQSDD